MSSARHNSVRKAVECFVMVLLRLMHILYNPCSLQHMPYIANVVRACVIIHNKIAAMRGYYVTMKFVDGLAEVYQSYPLD